MTPCWGRYAFLKFSLPFRQTEEFPKSLEPRVSEGNPQPTWEKRFKMVHTNNINKCKNIQTMFKIISVYPTTEAIILQTMGTLHDGT